MWLKCILRGIVFPPTLGGTCGRDVCLQMLINGPTVLRSYHLYSPRISATYTKYPMVFNCECHFFQDYNQTLCSYFHMCVCVGGGGYVPPLIHHSPNENDHQFTSHVCPFTSHLLPIHIALINPLHHAFCPFTPHLLSLHTTHLSLCIIPLSLHIAPCCVKG